MKSFIAIALCIASVVAVGSAAPTSTQTIQAQFTPLFTQLGEDAENGDLNGASSTLQQTLDLSDSLLSQTDDQDAQAILIGIKNEIEPQLTKINAGESSPEDLKNIVGDISLAFREVGGWAAGTVIGLANAAAQGVGGAVKGLENGLKNGGLINGITGALNGATHGISNGAGKGFINGFGGILSG